jgi:N-terminal domain on NACHT_NTPase and P-loop NTPases
MAEAAAALGLVTAILQVVEYGSKLVTRLNEFRTTLDEAPRAFRDIMVELPLLLNSLDRTRQQAERGIVDKPTQEALLPVIQGCHSQINALNNTILKITPKRADSSFHKSIKAVQSVGYERNIKHITSTLRGYILTLTYHESTGYKSPPIPPQETIFNVPFNRDRGFIGRVDVLKDVENAFMNGSRIALAGIGGIG